jgi:hypothetical protein
MIDMKKEKIEQLVKESESYSEISRKLYGNNFYGNRQTIKKYIKKYNINVEHITSLPIPYKLTSHSSNFQKKLLSEILVENSSFDTTHLKNRLYDEGLKERICEKCGQDEWWHGEKIRLILDHINGINNDHRFENLRILCPNCSAALSTFSGKNVNHPKKQKIKKNNLDVSITQRKVKRPEFEQLQNEIKELGYSGTGRKYGVSDNAIRKWIKFYKKHIPL